MKRPQASLTFFTACFLCLIILLTAFQRKGAEAYGGRESDATRVAASPTPPINPESERAARRLPPFFPIGADLLELIELDPTIKLDIRYARDDNFVGRKVYTEARAFLQRPAAEAVVRVHRELKKQGLGLVIFDGYRPWSVTKIFWEVTPEDKRKFVANPQKGSIHNRGCAVDLGIYDLKTGALVPMPSDFDEFTERASPDYSGGTEVERRNRDLLRSSMEAEGFTVNANEWWHFDYKDWNKYGIYDIAFSEVRDVSLIEGFAIKSVKFYLDDGTEEDSLTDVSQIKTGKPFSKVQLTKGLDAVNLTSKFRKLDLIDVSWFPDRKSREVDIVIFVSRR